MTQSTTRQVEKENLEQTFGKGATGEWEYFDNGIEMTLCIERPGDGSITHMWVDPDLRGEGIGSRLVKIAKELIRDSAPEQESYYLNIQIQDPGGVDLFLARTGFTTHGYFEQPDFDNPIIEGFQRFN